MTDTILIAEDDPLQQRTLTNLLAKRFGYQVVVTSDGREALERIRNSNTGDISAVLLDIHMPHMNGIEALKAIRSQYHDLPVLMLTGSDDSSVAVQAIKEGANDYIVKPPDPEHLDISIRNAIRLSSVSRELARLRHERDGTLAFTDLVGHGGGLAEAVGYGRKASTSDVPVLIMGETGVGKELFAQAIHGESRRAGAPFIAINCSAIPTNLVESTLFGHEKGAFTGAVSRAIGKFREAEGGTLFLDEIGELPLESQAKLLRAIQQKEVEPVGAGRPLKVNVRIISATNRDLRRDVQAGRFREDLYFRLNVLPITVPPLRERTQDILPLAARFIEQLCASDGLVTKSLTQEAKDYLIHRAWPGNVRELQNVIHRALVLSDEPALDKEAIARIHEREGFEEPVERRTLLPMHINLRLPDGGIKPMPEIEAEAMRLTLAHFGYNVAPAADALGMAKSTFYRKMKEYGIQVDS